MNHDQLIAHLTTSGVLRTPHLVDAFQKIDRADFVPGDLRIQTYFDTALPIGFSQTISQPTTVAFMLELLQPQPGERILDVGSGSGWTTALLAHIVGPRGIVNGTEIIPELVRFGQSNLAKYNFRNAEINRMNALDSQKGAPFDRILASATADHVPQELIDQLRNDGTLVMPIRRSVISMHKKPNGKIHAGRYEGFAFVPLRY